MLDARFLDARYRMLDFINYYYTLWQAETPALPENISRGLKAAPTVLRPKGSSFPCSNKACLLAI
ncbi:MAG: hypothetical protein JSV47_13565 [Deltaproteobacteria bacterium]|nr:MAG: hypothetical protein JSV47_13565 [Deltaproteobacteria bacterium]